ncbi:MAG TPA: DUF6588 family protein [bacterium]
MKIKLGLTVVALVFVWSAASFGQDLDIANLILPPNTASPNATDQATQNLDEVIDPLLDLFGFYTGGGLYHSGKVHGLGGFDVGVRVITMMISEDQKPDLPFPSSNAVNGGVFRGMELMPLPLLQVSLGLPGNLEATGRFFTYPLGEDEKEGNITLIGLGVKYGLLQNMLLPRVAVVAAYHYLNVPEEFDFGSVNSISAALIVSKGFPFIDLYGGIGVDRNTLEVDLTLPPPLGPVSKKYEKSNFRGNLGFKLKPFPLLFIHVDYNFGSVQGFNAGLGLSFR